VLFLKRKIILSSFKKYSLILFSVISAVILLQILSSCGEKESARSAGTAVPLSSEPEQVKVVSLAPSLTEMIFFLGKGKNLIGCTTACNYPSCTAAVEKVGGFGKPSIEKLISLRPDAVVASALADKAVRNTIEQYGIKFYLLPSDKLSDYPAALEQLGKILKCGSEAAEKIEEFRKQIEKFRQENKMLKSRPRVYLEVWNNPYMTIGKRSFINEMIKLAGGENIASDIDKGYFNFSLEWLLKSDPEVIICPAMGEGAAGDVEKRAGWQNISAVKNHRVYTGIDNDILYRLGPRTVEGIILLRKIIEGDSDSKQKGGRSDEE